MRRRAFYAEFPARRSSPCRHRELRIAGTILESDREIDALRRRQERFPRRAQRISGVLLVARHDDDDVHALQYAGCLKRLERANHDDVATFHVDDTGTARGALVYTLELLKRTVLFKHRVEVSDEQDARSRARMIGDEMSRALERGAVDPSRAEPERIELGTERAPDFSDALEILRAAVDVDDTLEQRERLMIVRVNVGAERALVGGQAG